MTLRRLTFRNPLLVRAPVVLEVSHVECTCVECAESARVVGGEVACVVCHPESWVWCEECEGCTSTRNYVQTEGCNTLCVPCFDRITAQRPFEG